MVKPTYSQTGWPLPRLDRLGSRELMYMIMIFMMVDRAVSVAIPVDCGRGRAAIGSPLSEGFIIGVLS